MNGLIEKVISSTTEWNAMVMSLDERFRFKNLMTKLQESDSPTAGNTAVFSDDQGTLLYAGIITDWPTVISVDVEWGVVK
jgi:hypothetical protein